MSGSLAQSNPRIFYGWFVVAGTFAVTFVGFGCAYTFSAFLPSLQQDFAASRGSISLVFSLAGFLYFALGMVSGPLADGWPQGAPYDVVVLEGATEVEPHALCQQLKDGGRLVCVQGSGPGCKAMLYRRSNGEVGGRAVFDAPAALLPGFAKTPVFAF